MEAMVGSCVSGRCERRRESQRQHGRGSKPRHALLLRFTETSPRETCVCAVGAAPISNSERTNRHCGSRSLGTRARTRRTIQEGRICCCHERSSPQFWSLPPTRTGPTECDDTAADGYVMRPRATRFAGLCLLTAVTLVMRAGAPCGHSMADARDGPKAGEKSRLSGCSARRRMGDLGRPVTAA
jgi:hypothetical protein